MLIMCSNQSWHNFWPLKFTSPDIFACVGFAVFPGQLGFSFPLLSIHILLQCFPELWVWNGGDSKSQVPAISRDFFTQRTLWDVTWAWISTSRCASGQSTVFFCLLGWGSADLWKEGNKQINPSYPNSTPDNIPTSSRSFNVIYALLTSPALTIRVTKRWLPLLWESGLMPCEG